MTIRIGICGFGKMGQTRAQAIAEHGGGRVDKVFDIELPDDLPYQRAASIDAVIADPEIDAVYVCLPNYLNKATTIKALTAGKHVFCEKPPALTADDVREIIEAERRSDKVLMYGFNHRHHAGIIKLRELIDTGRYGRILWMRGRYGKSVDADYLRGWRAKKELAGGGILLDQGIHMLDLTLFLARCEFDEVHALVSSLYWNTPEIEDNVFAMMRNTETGLCVSVHSTMTQWRHLFSLEVFLQRGYMVLNGLKTSSGTYGDEVLTVALNRTKAPAASWETEERFSFHKDTSWLREADIFLKTIASGEKLTTGTSQQALTVMELIGRIYQSQTHQAAHLYDDL